MLCNSIEYKNMKLREIQDILDASLIIGEAHLDREIHTCGASDLMSDILAKLAEGCIFLTGLTTVHAVRTAAISGVGAVVFVRNKIPPEDVIAMAKEEEIPLFTSPYSMFVSCGRLHAKGLTGLNGDR
jgi:predicted transcriptional regulator